MRVQLAVALLLVVPVRAGAEWHFKPFLGFSFEPSTTLVGDLELAAGLPVDPEVESQSSNVTFGAAVALLGDVFGIEGEWTQAPGFFQTRDQELVASSSAQTFTGSRDHRDAAQDRAVHVTAVLRWWRRRLAPAECRRSGPRVGAVCDRGDACGHRCGRWGQRLLQRASWCRLGPAVLPLGRRRGDPGSQTSPLMGWRSSFLFGAPTWRSY